jgi:hypothetical protein
VINDHNLQISEQEYRDLPLPSYSMLSGISKGGIDIMSGVKNSMFVLKFGSLVDDMCFDTPKVKTKYHLAGALKSPTPNVKGIVDQVIAAVLAGENESSSFNIVKKKKMNSLSTVALDLNNYGDTIMLAAKMNNVYQSYAREKVISTVVSAGQAYFQDALTSRGKILIKKEMWDKAMETSMTLATHQFSKSYFDAEPGIELFYQYKFVIEVRGRKTKGMLDILKVDHNTKTVYPVDLKTGEMPVSKFPEIMLMYGYYIQAGLYREAMMSIVEADPDLAGYTVAPFEFLYISKENASKPLVYVVPERMHQASLVGFTDRYGTKHKGIMPLLKEYYDCKEGMFCQYTEEEYDQDGKIPFDEDLIKEIEDEN